MKAKHYIKKERFTIKSRLGGNSDYKNKKIYINNINNFNNNFFI